MKIQVYSDGSGNTFSGTGGWAYRIIIDGEVKAQAGGHLPYATNNVAELYGAVEGLSETKRILDAGAHEDFECWLVSDSKLVLGYADGSFKCKAKHLEVLHKKIRELYVSLSVKTLWVKGHSGDTHNEACDKLAKAARKSSEPAG